MSELMTEEEIHHFGIKIVFEQLNKEGYEVLSVDTNSTVNPQIVAMRDGNLAFVVVRTACYPNKGAIANRELELKLIEHADKNNATCYFASVGIANAEAKNDEEMAQPVRGAVFHVAYDGLLILTLSNRVRVLAEPGISKDDIRPNRGPLSRADLPHLARCMAVAGSGTYALRGTQDQQITRIRTVLLMAKEEGADWMKIYSAVYEVLGKTNPHFPTEQEMRHQVEAAFHEFTHRDR